MRRASTERKSMRVNLAKSLALKSTILSRIWRLGLGKRKMSKIRTARTPPCGRGLYSGACHTGHTCDADTALM